MTEADIVAAEVFAWQRYTSYITSVLAGQQSTYVFLGDEASRGLYRDWQAAREARDELFPPWRRH